MAGLYSILTALARVVWRDLRTFNSLTGNNFFLFAALLLQQPQSAMFFVLILALLLMGPLSSDPLRKIPPDRLALWPLSERQRLILRSLSPAFSPIAWLILPLLWWVAGAVAALSLIGFTVVLQLLLTMWNRFTAGQPRRNIFWHVGRPPGRLGGLIQKDIRQMLSVLDPYVALLLSICGVWYRIFGTNPDPEARVILTLVVALALSTYAQCLFGLDLAPGLVRYRLWPIAGREILLAKGIAFLAILMVLVAPLAPLPGLAAGLIALGAGHHASITRPRPQTRWRFTGGAVFPTGLYQVVPMFAAGVAVARESAWYLALAFAFYLASLWYCGRLWDRGSDGL